MLIAVATFLQPTFFPAWLHPAWYQWLLINALNKNQEKLATVEGTSLLFLSRQHNISNQQLELTHWMQRDIITWILVKFNGGYLSCSSKRYYVITSRHYKQLHHAWQPFPVNTRWIWVIIYRLLMPTKLWLSKWGRLIWVLFWIGVKWGIARISLWNIFQCSPKCRFYNL